MDDSISNPSPSLLPPDRPRSLLDLPTELLGVIVKMCADQDEAFRHRVKLIKSHYLETPHTDKILDDQVANGYGYSSNAMFQLCRRTKELAAPYIFKTLTASRIVDLAYRFFIFPQYLRHYQHVIFNEVEKEAAINLIASFGSFTSLHALTLHATAAQSIFGHDIYYTPSSASNPVIAMLAQKGKAIRTLHLHDFDFRETVQTSYLKKFPNITSLSLVGLLHVTTANATKLIGSIPRLETLTLDNRMASAMTFPTQLSYPSWPDLRKLILITNNVQTETFEFIRKFESCLRELSITTPDDHALEEDPARMSPGARFAQLHTIDIIGSSMIAWSVFGDSTESTYPSLARVRLSYSDEASHGFGENDKVLCKILDNSRIHFIRYDPPDQDIRLKHKEYLETKSVTSGFRLQVFNYPERAVPSLQALDGPDDCIDLAKIEYVDRRRIGSRTAPDEPLPQQVERLRDHLDDSIKVAELTGNLVEYQRILNLARPLEYDRLAKMD